MTKYPNQRLLLGAAALLTCVLAGTAYAGGRVSLTDIEARLAAIETLLGGIADTVGDDYVPFKVEINGGICNAAAVGSSNPDVRIDGNAPDGTFVVTSILMRTDSIPVTGFVELSLNRISIDGTAYDLRTDTLAGPVDGSAVVHSFDILGTPVKVTGDGSQLGGNVPHQIVARSAGSNDIIAELFCRSDVEDLSITRVIVAGWKRPGETITVTYVP